MTYSDSARGVRIDRKRAEQECRAHGVPAAEIPELLASIKWDSSGRTDAYGLLLELGY